MLLDLRVVSCGSFQNSANSTAKTIQRIRDLCLKAVPIFPSYAPAPITYKVKKIKDGINLSKCGMPRLLTIMYMIRKRVILQMMFSSAAIRLAVLVTSVAMNGLRRNVELIYGALHKMQKYASIRSGGLLITEADSRGHHGLSIVDAAPT